MDVSYLLDPLNEAQRQAVCAPLGHCLVLAGAGSGKTRVLTHRIGWLVSVGEVSPYAILAVTFTNKAAGEMRARTEQLLPGDARRLTVGTFHGIAHRLLRQHWKDAGLPETFQILDADDQLRLLKKTIQALGMDEAMYPPRQAMWFINHAKDEGKRPDGVNLGYHPQNQGYLEIYRAYETACARSGLVDFAELLLRTHELLLRNEALLAHYRQRYRHILVDEFQDTNTLQYAFLRLLAGPTGCVFAVGDDDQAIYGWRGAKVENVQAFLRDFVGAKTLRLEQNYRSTGNILNAANAVIKKNQARLGKALWTEAGVGAEIDLYAAFNAEDEARFVVDRIKQWANETGRYSDCAVLYRSNAQSRLFEEQLILRDVPYRVYGGLRFFERAEIKDALAYLRLLASRDDDAAFERACANPPKGIGDRTLDQLRAKARAANVSLWKAAHAPGEGELNARAKSSVAKFCEAIEAMAEESRDLPFGAAVAYLIDRSNLKAHYEKDSKGLAESRIENLEELIQVAERFVLREDDKNAGLSELNAFLSTAALEAGEAEGEAWEDCVQLMTMHSAKGLEFPLVFLVGMEDGLFPNLKSMNEPQQLEEERRLAYVGITRARQKLVLAYAEYRRMHGVDNYNRPSRFLADLPPETVREVRPKVQVSRPASYIAYQNAPVRGSQYPEQKIPFKLGQNVLHRQFGEGTVVTYEGSGEHTIVVVNFPVSGTKRLVLAYANLQGA